MNSIEGLDYGTDAFFHFQRTIGPAKVLQPFMEALNFLGGYLPLAILAVAIMGLLGPAYRRPNKPGLSPTVWSATRIANKYAYFADGTRRNTSIEEF